MNSIAYVKITFSVAVSLPFPFIRSIRIEFCFSVYVWYTARKRQRRYRTAVRTRIAEMVSETDERERSAGNPASHTGRYMDSLISQKDVCHEFRVRCLYRLMLLGRATPVVDRSECAWSQRTVAKAEHRHRQHRHRIVCTPHAGGSGADTRTLSCACLYRGGIVYDGPRPRPQSEETSHLHEVYGRRRR